MKIKDSGNRKKFSTGAVRDVSVGKGRFDLLPMRALHELSRLYEQGCLKYGDRNWEKGIDFHCYVDSGMRHLSNVMLGITDEPHLIQSCWNLLCLLDTVIRVRDGNLSEKLFDLPIDEIALLSGNLKRKKSTKKKRRKNAVYQTRR